MTNVSIYHMVLDAGLSASDIRCMGITTQRNTFITWDKSASYWISVQFSLRFE